MRKLQIIALAAALVLSLPVAPTAQAKAKITKPSAPTIVSIVSSTAKKGKVNLKVTISLPTSNGGSKITGSKVTASGKSCTIMKTKTSCTIKAIKSGNKVKVSANSKNKKGFGPSSAKVTYVAGAAAYSVAPTVPVVALTCAKGGKCKLGDIGPGGGIVYFYMQTGFACGSEWPIDGPIENWCHYLEVAPNGWSNGAYIDPSLPWADGGRQYLDVIGILNDTNIAQTGFYRLGRGYRNSDFMVSQGNGSNTAAGAARAYNGGSKNDWYLPSSAELNLLCQWADGTLPSIGITCNTTGGWANSSTYGAESIGLVGYYWTSSEDGQNTAWIQGTAGTYGGQIFENKVRLNKVRPIRAF